MRGLEGVKTLMSAHLAGHLPGVLEDVAGSDTAEPVAYREWKGQQMVASELPLIETICIATTPAIYLDQSEFGVPVFEIGYRLRTFATTRGDNFEETTTNRDHLATALLHTVLAFQQLAPDARIDPNTAVSSMSDIGLDPETGASIAAAYVEVVVKVEETVNIDPLATAERITAVVHPANL